MNTERYLKHAVDEKMAITVCINKVQYRFLNVNYMYVHT